MKKLISVILLIALCLSMLSLSACEFPWNEKPEEEVQLNIIDDKYRNWYEIFVRSYRDSDGDGIGALRGVEYALPSIASLGIDGIWLSLPSAELASALLSAAMLIVFGERYGYRTKKEMKK